MKIKTLDLSKAWVTWATVGFGCQVYVLFHPDYAGPLGFVWGYGHGGKKTRFEVYGSYIETYFRRLGVRTRINDEIFKNCDLITSPSASKLGKKFMTAQGYRFSGELSQWYKSRSRKLRAKS